MQVRETTFDVVKEPTLIIDEQGKVVYANPAAISAFELDLKGADNLSFPGRLRFVPEWPWTLDQLRDLQVATEYREFDLQLGKKREVYEICVLPLNPDGLQRNFLITCIHKSLELRLYQKSLKEKENTDSLLNAANEQQADLLLSNDRMERRLNQMSFLLKFMQKTRFVFEEKTIAHNLLDQIVKDLRFAGGHYFSWQEDKGLFALEVSVDHEGGLPRQPTGKKFKPSDFLDFSLKSVKHFSEESPLLAVTDFFNELQDRKVYSVALVPIKTQVKFFGVFVLINYMQAPVLDENTANFLKYLIEPISSTFETALLYRSSITDETTGLDNSRYFSSRVAEEVVRARQNQTLLSVLLVDIDNFKKLNEEHGYEAGNKVLYHVARTMKSLVRPSDTIARFERDEIVAAMPGIGRVSAEDYASRLNQALEQNPVEGPNGPIQVTVTTGISLCPEHGTTPADLLATASQMIKEKKDKPKVVELLPELRLKKIRKVG
jgi:diguanylate cyclase (GGDEF)-like protein